MMKVMAKIGVLMVCICMVCSLSSCKRRIDIGKGESYIYCLNSDRTGLQKVTYEITQEEPVEAAQAMLHELQKPAEDIEYTPPIGSDIEVRSCTLEGEVLYVDFSTQYRKMSSIEEILVRGAIVQSLVKIDGITSVWFRVEGEDLKDSSGGILGYMNGDDFVQNLGSSPSSYQKETFTLYFSNKEGNALVEETVDIKYNSNIPKEKLIVENLIKGPKTDGRYPSINPDVNVLSVTIKDGICYINFDKTFLKSVYEVRPEITIYSLVNSLIEGTEADMVQISINGEQTVKYMETIDLTKPLKEDFSWIEKKGNE